MISNTDIVKDILQYIWGFMFAAIFHFIKKRDRDVDEKIAQLGHKMIKSQLRLEEEKLYTAETYVKKDDLRNALMPVYQSLNEIKRDNKDFSKSIHDDMKRMEGYLLRHASKNNTKNT